MTHYFDMMSCYKLYLNGTRAGSILSISFLVLFLYIIYYCLYQNDIPERKNYIQKYLVYKYQLSQNTSIVAYRFKQHLEKINKNVRMLNFKKFYPVSADTSVIVIQVHKDIHRLQYLVASLAQVRSIERALLIFSHSFYDDIMNQLIKSIDFCKVIQIFYPHSLQLNPKRFPGVDPEDCNASLHNSTQYCLVRDAYLTEAKQHWWWKANFVFNSLAVCRSHKAPIIFLEEDDCVAPDLLYVFQYAKRSLLYFPRVEIISLGRSFPNDLDTSLLTLEPWRPEYSVGIAFNRSTWYKILSLSAEFCMYNDHNWAYSLLNLFHHFPRGFASMVGCMSPRVLSTRRYQNTSDIEKVPAMFKSLFPPKFQAVFLFGPDGWVEQAPKLPPEGAGGWNDLRDQVLCLDPLMSTTTEEMRYYDAYATLHN